MNSHPFQRSTVPCTVAHFKTCHPRERPLMQARRKKPYAGVQLQSTSARDFSESRKGVEFMRRTVKIRCATGPSGLAFVRSASNYAILPGISQWVGEKIKALAVVRKLRKKTFLSFHHRLHLLLFPHRRPRRSRTHHRSMQRATFTPKTPLRIQGAILRWFLRLAYIMLAYSIPRSALSEADCHFIKERSRSFLTSVRKILQRSAFEIRRASSGSLVQFLHQPSILSEIT